MLQIFLSKKLIFATIIILTLSGFSCKKQFTTDPVSALSISEFETRLDDLRTGAKIPGMAAGIIKDGQIIWNKNYGLADIQSNIPVTNATIFHLASLTKTFASAIIIQLVKENKIKLNDPVSNYNISLSEKDTVRVIHLLTHTSEGIPGSNYKYNGDRFSLLTKVIEVATGETFYKLVNDRIIEHLGLQSTAPSNMKFASSIGFDTVKLKQHTAQGYYSNGIQKVEYPKNFSTAAGLTSNIDDMLQYAASYDGTSLLSIDQKTQVFSPMISNGAKTLPYGLGWFIQEKERIKITWHYGYWIGMSSLIIRIPDKKLSFVLMANSDMLSAPFPLSAGDIWVSPYAREFLKSFVLAGAKL